MVITAIAKYTAKYWKDRFIVHATAGDTGGAPLGYTDVGATIKHAPTHTVVKPPYLKIPQSQQYKTTCITRAILVPVVQDRWDIS